MSLSEAKVAHGFLEARGISACPPVALQVRTTVSTLPAETCRRRSPSPHDAPQGRSLLFPHSGAMLGPGARSTSFLDETVENHRHGENRERVAARIMRIQSSHADGANAPCGHNGRPREISHRYRGTWERMMVLEHLHQQDIVLSVNLRMPVIEFPKAAF